jgi:hypothetical protein
MDFHIIGEDANFHVLTTHTTAPDDKSPLQYISAERLLELERSEAAEKLRVPAAQLEISPSSVTTSNEK